MEYQVLHRLKDNQGEFYIEINGEKQGSMHYTLFGSGRLVIQHTEVSRDLQGTGASKQLLAKTIEHARSNDLMIVPICPFAKAMMTRSREKYRDILIG